MIEMKAKVLEFKGDNGAELQLEGHMEGSGGELIHEGLAIIRALMKDFKGENPMLHMAIIREIAANPNILLGEDDEEKSEHERFAKMMAEMTSKGIIGKGDLN